MVVNNNWTNFKNHYELKSDNYNDDISNLFNLFSLELVNENIDEDEGDDFIFQLHYPVFYYPGNLFIQIFKKFKYLNARYTHDDEEHIYYEDFLNAGRQLQLPGDWRYLSPPKKPSPPFKKETPTTYRATVERTSGFGCAFSAWLVIITLFAILPGISMSKAEGSYEILIVLIIAWIPILIYLLYTFVGTHTDFVEKRYSNKVIEDNEKKNQQEYEYKRRKYENDIENYTNQLKSYENHKREQIASIDKYFSEISAHIWKSNMKSTLGYERTDTPPQRGSYENALFYELMKKYPNYVKIDTKVGSYYPDIVISIKDEVFIDIEIDEPYVYNTKQETHYISCGDEKRNEFFMENNWFVIRLAECQLINNMDKCFSFVDSIIQFILTGDTQHIVTATELKESLLIKRWTKEGARMMAIEDIRRTSRNYPTR